VHCARVVFCELDFFLKYEIYIYCDGFAEASLYDRPLGALRRLPCATVCSEHAIAHDVMLYGACAGDVRQRWRPLLWSVDSPLPGDDNVIRLARIREMSQAVFPASQLGALLGCIR
jgi:hypothetical protein